MALNITGKVLDTLLEILAQKLFFSLLSATSLYDPLQNLSVLPCFNSGGKYGRTNYQNSNLRCQQ